MALDLVAELTISNVKLGQGAKNALNQTFNVGQANNFSSTLDSIDKTVKEINNKLKAQTRIIRSNTEEQEKALKVQKELAAETNKVASAEKSRIAAEKRFQTELGKIKNNVVKDQQRINKLLQEQDRLLTQSGKKLSASGLAGRERAKAFVQADPIRLARLRAGTIESTDPNLVPRKIDPQRINNLADAFDNLNKELKDFITNQNKADAARAKASEKEEKRIAKSRNDFNKLILSTQKKIETEQKKVNALLEVQDRTLAETNQKLTREQQLLRNRARSFVQADPQSLARARLGLAATPTGIGGLSPRDIDSTTRSLNDLSKATQSFASNRATIESFGRSAALAVKRYGAFLVGSFGVLQLIQAFRESGRAALEFEANLTKLEQVLRVNQESLSSIKDELLATASAFGTSANELAQGVFIFAQAGFKNINDLQQIIETLARIPLAATFSDIESTAEGALAILGQFKLELSDLGNVIDLTNQFAADFAIESNDIFEAVKKGGASFATAGGSFEEFIQLLSILRESTRESAAVLGTFFKSGFGRILSPDSQDLLKQLGVTASDTVGQVTQLSDILFGPNSQFTNIERINIAEQLVGLRQFSRLLALTREVADPDIQQRLSASLIAAPGSLDRDTAKRLDDIGQSFARIREEFNRFAEEIAQNQSLKNFVSLIADLVSRLGNLAGIIGNLAPALGILGIGAGVRVGRRFAAGANSLFGFGQTNSRLRDSSALQALGVPGRSLRSRIGGAGLSLARSRGGRLAGLTGLAVAGTSFASSENPFVNAAGGALSGGLIGGFLTGGPGGALIGGLAGLINALNENAQTTKENTRAFLAASQNRTLESVLFGNIDAQIASLGSTINGPIIDRRTGRSSQEAINQFSSRFLGPNVNEVDAQFANIFANLVAESITSVRQQAVAGTFKPAAEIVSEAQLRSGARDLAITRLQEVAPNLNIAFSNLDLFAVAIDTFLQNANITEVSRQVNDFGESLVEINNRFRKGVLDFANTLDIVADNANLLDSAFKNIVTNIDNNQTLTSPIGSVNILRSAGGFDNLVSFLETDLAGITNNLSQFLSQQRGNLRALTASFEGGPDLAPDFESNTITDPRSTIAAIVDSFGGIENKEALTDELTQLVGRELAFLVNFSGKNVSEVLSDLVDVGPDGLRSFVLETTKLGEIIDKTVQSIQREVELFNQRLNIQDQLNQQTLSVNQQIFDFNTNLRSLGEQLAERRLIGSQSTRAGAGVANQAAQASLLFQQAGISGGTSTQQLIQALRNAAQERERAVRDAQNAGLGGLRGERPLEEQRRALEQSLEAQFNYARQQQLVNQRLTELNERVRQAAAAADLFRQAAQQVDQQLQSTGASLIGLTGRDLKGIFDALGRFGAAGGLNNTQAGLLGVGRGGFDQLLQGLNLIGNFSLGGGLSGSDILANIQRDLAVPFLSQALSGLTGTNVTEGDIRQQIATLEKQAADAAALEERLRQEQIALVTAQRDIAANQLQFIADQNKLLEDIVKNLTNNTDIQAIRSKTDLLFTQRAQAVTTDTSAISASSVSSLTAALSQGQGSDRAGQPIFFREFVSAAQENVQATIANRDALNEIYDRIASQDAFLANTQEIGTISEQLSVISITLAELKDYAINQGFKATLEVSPIQVNVGISVPDIIKTIGPSIKGEILSAIGKELSEIFGVVGDTETASRLANLGN